MRKPKKNYQALGAEIDQILQQAVPEDDYCKGAHRFFAESDVYGQRALAVERIVAAIREHGK